MSGNPRQYSFNRGLNVSSIGGTKNNAPGSIHLSFGFPASDLLPVEAVNRAAAEAISREHEDALHYSGAEGPQRVRNWVLKRMKRLGIHAEPQHYLATYGATQGIDLAARVLINPGEEVWVEAPTFFNALQSFRFAGAGIRAFPVDEDGLRVDEVQRALEKNVSEGGVLPKFIYVMPNFQNPTGVSLSLERREKLARLAQAYNVFILEDDAYAELLFDGQALPSIYSFAPEHVVYLSTFSKTLGPGLRLGWVIAPSEVIGYMNALSLGSQPGPLTQEILGSLLEDYEFEQQVRRLNERYRFQRDKMVASLVAGFGENVHFQIPKGGFFLWVSFPEGTDIQRLQILSAEEGVSFVPGSAFYPEAGSYPSLRLCFSYCSHEQIEQGIDILSRAYAVLQKEAGAQLI
ncbi:aminotransferase-like domain-containing protein [Paenibacillus sp. HW567]|uniref:aminotransferase-like domain-containing protein n=1 Tax=Paenibacillus sp. HW567 TaxID=1034769 RepID=UPI0003609220|nr:PLP-dependent aminotransferase family protein [Paenibacillus sp. HW567]